MTDPGERTGETTRGGEPPHPYRALFTPRERDRRFGAIRSEARERGLDLADPEVFARLAESRSALRGLAGRDATPEALQQLGSLLFQAWHFHRAGEPVVALDEETCRALLDRGDDEDWSLGPGKRAGYLRLPEGLFRSPAAPGVPPTWLAGMFWTRGSDGLILLPVLEGDAAGFTLLPLPPLPQSAGPLMAGQKVRDGEPDFAPTAGGGGPADGFVVAAAAEIVKLAARALWWLSTR